MPVVKLTQTIVNTELRCPSGTRSRQESAHVVHHLT